MDIEKIFYTAVIIAAALNAFKNILKSFLIELEIKKGSDASSARSKYKKDRHMFSEIIAYLKNKKRKEE